MLTMSIAITVTGESELRVQLMHGNALETLSCMLSSEGLALHLAHHQYSLFRDAAQTFMTTL